MTEEAAPAPAAAGKKKPNVPLFAIIGVVVVLNGAMVGKIFLGGKHPAKEAPKTEEIGPKMALDEFLVNLGGSTDHYLKATLSLGLKKGETEEKLKDEIAPIRDAIISVMASKQPEDLATDSGREKLKDEIVIRVNRALDGKKVAKVYFTSFATQ